MRALRENVVHHGGTMYRKHCVFGDPKLAENILAWSQQGPVGRTFEKETPWGLKLTAFSAEDSPKVILEFDCKKFHDFTQSLSPVTMFKLMSYGVTVIGPQNTETQDFIPNNKADYILALYLGDQEEDTVFLVQVEPSDNETLVLGTITMNEDGFYFIDTNEMEKLGIMTLEEVTA